jgi:hypothetical protein
MTSQIPKQPSILVVLDDTLVKKCGSHIQGTYVWFDHTCRRVVTSLCLVNVSVVVEDQLLFILPWVLRRPKSVQQNTGKSQKEQDTKTLAAIDIIRTFFSRLDRGGILETQIVVVADS